MPIDNSSSDTWFKLRLSAPLRKQLEAEAAERGRTLTAEILARLESTLTGSDKRIDQLELLTSDDDYGNRTLWKSLLELYDQMAKLSSELEVTKEYAGVPRYDPD